MPRTCVVDIEVGVGTRVRACHWHCDCDCSLAELRTSACSELFGVYADMEKDRAPGMRARMSPRWVQKILGNILLGSSVSVFGQSSKVGGLAE